MTVSADRICSGIAYPAAVEIARQMNVGAPSGGNASLLVNLGIPPMSATELARQINAGAFSADLLCRAMWNGHIANIIKKDSGL